ncbi:MAG TPA: TolC family protein [Capsulimonadaceae bacterium]|jgi:outer membrane protein TolC
MNHKRLTYQTACLAAITTLAVPAYAVPPTATATDTQRSAVADTGAPLTVDGAIAYALTHNPDLRGSVADAAGAAADTSAALAQQKLRVSANLYGTAGNMSNIVMSAPDVAPQSFVMVPSKGFVDQNITAAIPLTTGGRREALVRSARNTASAAASGRDAMAHHLAADVASAYIDAVLAADLQAVAQSRVDAETEQVRIVAERVANGKLAEVDNLREQAELADARQAFISAQTRAQLALVTLKTAMGADQTTLYTLSDTLDTLSKRWPAPVGTMGQAIAAGIGARFEITSAQRTLDAAKEQVNAAKALFKPQVVGFGMLDINSPVERNVSATTGYTVGVAASLPLADGGERRANTAAAQEKAARADADAGSTRNRIAGEIAEAWLRLSPASGQVTAAEAGFAASQKAYDLSVMRYDAGKAIAAERLAALSALTRARGSLREAIAEQIKARLALVRATGAELGGVGGH